MQQQINQSPDEPRVGDGAFYLCMSVALVAASALQITALVGTIRMSGTAPVSSDACALSVAAGSTHSTTTLMNAAAPNGACAVRAVAD